MPPLFVLKQFAEFLDGVAGLLDDRGQGFAFQLPVVEGQGNAQVGICRVFENVMGTGGVVNKKARSLQSAENFFGGDNGKVLAHPGLGKCYRDLLFHRIGR